MNTAICEDSLGRAFWPRARIKPAIYCVMMLKLKVHSQILTHWHFMRFKYNLCFTCLKQNTQSAAAQKADKSLYSNFASSITQLQHRFSLAILTRVPLVFQVYYGGVRQDSCEFRGHLPQPNGRSAHIFSKKCVESSRYRPLH